MSSPQEAVLQQALIAQRAADANLLARQLADARDQIANLKAELAEAHDDAAQAAMDLVTCQLRGEELEASRVVVERISALHEMGSSTDGDGFPDVDGPQSCAECGDEYRTGPCETRRRLDAVRPPAPPAGDRHGAELAVAAQELIAASDPRVEVMHGEITAGVLSGLWVRNWPRSRYTAALMIATLDRAQALTSAGAEVPS